MHPVTQLLFHDVPKSFSFSLPVSLAALRKLGIEVERDPLSYRFSFHDEYDFSARLCTDGNSILMIYFAIREESSGWANWSHQREIRILDLQEQWLKDRDLDRLSYPELEVSNAYDERGAFASITLLNRRPANRGARS